MVGEKFGRLLVVSQAESKRYGKTVRSQWLCHCDCGNKKTILGNSLRSGQTNSCGCLNQELRKNRKGKNHHNWKGGRHENKYGYVVLSVDGRKVFEHVLVMESNIGRPLHKGEQVHHKNGIRNDNRIENLELWTTHQPNGKRVSDIISYAIEIISQYHPELLK